MFKMVVMPVLKFPKINFATIRKVILLAIIVSVTFSSGYFLGLKGYRASIARFPSVTINREIPSEKESLDFSLFWRVWDTLETKYFDKTKIIPSQMVYGAIKGMVASLNDPYTVFLPPEENKIVQEDLQGSFEGVGIQIGFKGTQLAVIAPLPGSPAEKAGIRAGDYIIGIKDSAKNLDRGTVGISLPEAVEAIRGENGSEVILTLLREGEDEPKVIAIIRESIDVASVIVEYLPASPGSSKIVAHVKLLKFSGETLAEWEEVVIDILKKPDLSGLIVDVRNNPGGFLQGAVEVASDFLDTGEVVVIEEDYSGKRQEYRVEKLGRLRNEKVVILVNQGSASASEIFAGAMMDHERAEIVGETSFGKGTIQEPQQINGNAGLHITIARWLTPDGFWVNEGGLKPDVEIADNTDTPEDEQLLKAIENLSTNI